MDEQAELTFPAPARKSAAGINCTSNNSAPDLVTFNKILTVPGAAVQYAADRFAEWGK